MSSAAERPPALLEGITIDPDYAGRTGYDSEFLGADALSVPLPALSAEQVALAAVNQLATADPRQVLPYHHFSVVLNRERRLAFFTAVDIDAPRACVSSARRIRGAASPAVLEGGRHGQGHRRPLGNGYLLSQEDLISGLEVLPEAFSYGACRTYQVTVRRIEELTVLSFGPLVDADPVERLEGAVAAAEIGRFDEIVL